MEKTTAAQARSAYSQHLCAFKNGNKPDGAPLPFCRARRTPCSDLAPGALYDRSVQEGSSFVSTSRRRHTELRT